MKLRLLFFFSCGIGLFFWMMIFPIKEQAQIKIEPTKTNNSIVSDQFKINQRAIDLSFDKIQDGNLSRFKSEIREIQEEAKGKNRHSRFIVKTLSNKTDGNSLEITLRFTQEAESNLLAKTAIQRAAAKWGAYIGRIVDVPQDKLSITVDIDFAKSAFGVPFQTIGTIAKTTMTPVYLISTQAAPFSALWEDRYYSYEHQRIVQQKFTTTTIPTDIGNTSFFIWTQGIYKALNYSSFREYQHFVAFNSAIKYDFDPSDGIDPDKFDFEALVSRELGRLLGFISTVGVREINPKPESGLFGLNPAAPTMWDWFRFRPGVTIEDFSSALRLQRAGGEQVFFTGDLEVPLASGDADAADWEGLNPDWLRDGRAAGHWRDDALTGQYIGIMDEKYLPGERGGLTATDLTALSYFAYRINPEATVMEVLSVDDGSREQILPPNNAIIVNRLTPARAPFTVESVRVQLPSLADGSSTAGKRLRVVVFADTSRSGHPPANPQYLVDRTITISALAESRMLEVMLPQPVTVISGDLYVGVQAVDGDLSFAVDTNGELKNRSFTSTNNGASFQPLQVSGSSANMVIRAVVNSKFNAVSNRLPEVASISPDAASPGTGFKLTVFGQNFFPDSADAAGVRYKSVIRINGQDKVTEFLSLKQLRTEISAADLAGLNKVVVTVATTMPNGVVESAPIELALSPNAPLPILTRIDPPVVATSSQETKVFIFGRNFTAESVARLNGSNRSSRFINSTKLEATLPASDFATASNGEISVLTPSPGGGSSNAMAFRVAGCSYKLSKDSLTLGAARRFDENSELNLNGILLNTEDHCPWTASSNADWIVLADPRGKGRAPIGFNVLNNPDAAARTGTVTIAGQTLSINQVGAPTAVSSASYGLGSSPEGMTSLFGVNLAKSTQFATTQPLPTNLAGTTLTITRLGGGQPQLAPLFFVSPNQINFVVPTANDGTPLPPGGLGAFLSVYVDGQLTADGYILLSPVFPALFSADASGKGLAAALVLRVKANGTQSYEPVVEFNQAQNKFVARPIDLGPEGEKVFLVLFGTGIRGRTQLSAVTARVGGINSPVLYAGPQGDFAGLDQVNIELPRQLVGRGEVDVTCMANNFGANSVKVVIK